MKSAATSAPRSNYWTHEAGNAWGGFYVCKSRLCVMEAYLHLVEVGIDNQTAEIECAASQISRSENGQVLKE